MSKNFYPLIGFSSGDPNGIGLEVLLKSLSDSTLCNEFKSVVFVNHKLIESQNKFLSCCMEIMRNLLLVVMKETSFDHLDTVVSELT